MKTIKNITIMVISILGISILLTSGLISPAAGLTASSSTSSLGVFYYPWEGGNPQVSPTDTWRHWLDYSHNPPSTWASNYLPDYVPGFNPYEDLYSAKDPNVIKWQLGLMKKAGINFVISSWWGQNHYTDQALDIIFNQVMPDPSNPYPDAKFAIYYEKEGFANVPKAEIVSDINYIKNKYMNSSYYYTVDGRPVVFVYNAYGGLHGETSVQEAQKWKEVRDETGIYLVLKVFTDYKSYIGLSDSWHQYAPSMGYDIQGNYSAFVSPGFYKLHEQPRLARDDFVRFENDIKVLKDADVQFKLIETWNEWGEGTGIEPAQKINHDDVNGFTATEPSYGTRYVDIIAKYFNQNGTTIPIPTYVPTAVPTDVPTVVPTIVPTRGGIGTPIPNPAFRFVAWGDTKGGTNVLEAESKSIASSNLNPAFTLYAGDLCDSGPDTACFNVRKNAFSGDLSGVTNNGIFDKTFAIRGNHDSSGGSVWQSGFNFKGVASSIGATNYVEQTLDMTYSFDYGNSHFVGVDNPCNSLSGCAGDITTSQINWLDQDLTNAENRGVKHTFLFWHGPAYPVDGHCCGGVSPEMITVLNKHPIISAGFFGHEHVVEYTHLDSSTTPGLSCSIEQVISGGAGADLYGITAGRKIDYYLGQMDGYTMVDVSGNDFDVSFYKADGTRTKTLSFTETGTCQ